MRKFGITNTDNTSVALDLGDVTIASVAMVKGRPRLTNVSSSLFWNDTIFMF